MEEFRAPGGYDAVVFSPSRVRKLLDLQKVSEQAKQQQKVDKAVEIQQTVAAKELKAQEARQKRDSRVAASIDKKKAATRVGSFSLSTALSTHSPTSSNRS
jgi:hypothetical protein